MNKVTITEEAAFGRLSFNLQPHPLKRQFFEYDIFKRRHNKNDTIQTQIKASLSGKSLLFSLVQM